MEKANYFQNLKYHEKNKNLEEIKHYTSRRHDQTFKYCENIMQVKVPGEPTTTQICF